MQDGLKEWKNSLIDLFETTSTVRDEAVEGGVDLEDFEVDDDDDCGDEESSWQCSIVGPIQWIIEIEWLAFFVQNDEQFYRWGS